MHFHSPQYHSKKAIGNFPSTFIEPLQKNTTGGKEELDIELDCNENEVYIPSSLIFKCAKIKP